MINLEKSSLIFSANSPEELRTDVVNSLQIKEAVNPRVYLVFQSTWVKTKCGALSYIKDKVEAKLKTWKQQLLSLGVQGNKEVFDSLLTKLAFTSLVG